MAAIYLHRLTVTVVSLECSPDAIERIIDKAFGEVGMRADARTEPANRSRGPAIKIADAPEYPTDNDRKSQNAWADAHDAWQDSWPTVTDFETV